MTAMIGPEVYLKMLKRLTVIVIALAMIAALSACAGKAPEPAAGPSQTQQPAQTQAEAPQAEAPKTEEPAPAEEKPAYPFTFTDSLGREVTVEKRPERVACMIGSFADIYCLAGGKDDIIAATDDAWKNFDLGLSESAVKLGALNSPSTETLITADPDFIIASSGTAADLEMEDLLEKSGINYAYFDVSTFDDYLAMLDVCTSVTGEKALYEENGLSIRGEVEEAKAKADGSRPTVLYIRAAASVIKAKPSDDSVLGEMLKDLDCVNVADSDSSLVDDLGLEGILTADPEYIFVVFQGSDTEKASKALHEMLLDDPAWSSLTAVKEGRFHMLEKELYNQKPNRRWGEAYLKLANILYGE